MGEVADKAHNAGQQAHQSEWLDHAIRAGLVAYGIVHLMVAWLAAQLALGDKSESASNAGALHALAETPMGGVLIWLIAIGMMLLVVWRLLEFAMGYQDETDDAKRWRKRLASLGKATDGAVRYLASQPWPFPSNVMIGCIGEALTDDIAFDGEELEDARWFTKDDIRRMLDGTHEEFLAPAAIAIAHHLIREWVKE